MTSILTFSTAHFCPGKKAYYEHSSAGQLAKHLYSLLSGLGTCSYFDHTDKPAGLDADLYVGTSGSFKHVCGHNRIRRKILWCSSPAQDAELMKLCDLAVFVGNKTTAKFFPPGFESKIQTVNYGCNADWFERDLGIPRENSFVYTVSEASPFKGFLQVIEVWKSQPQKLHVMGYMNDPQMQKLFKEINRGQMFFHDYVPNDSAEFLKILKSCRFVYVPAQKEGQIGSVMEAMFSGLLALTTLESGLDERVLEHAFITGPGDVEAQKRFVDLMTGMSESEYTRRQSDMLNALHQYQNWQNFDTAVRTLLLTA